MWQAFHPPPGYAATNNPLEQYHKTLMLVNKSKRAAPIEMLEKLDQSRLVFANSNTTFKSTPNVSQRLKALYSLTLRKRELSAKLLAASDGIPAQLVQIPHIPRRRYGDIESSSSDDFFVEPISQNLPYNSIAYTVAKYVGKWMAR
ncbi:hypothetical protein L916_12368 [Phytophthora nicotianae]|uniref:Uncharacterized protein n=1 Tax=Phytophthora nicotianae TaxID=4792 RepID=W2IPN8_PHYNI|nr:hypothetical protein L916_12368 [Phytophthora nicotianae]